MSDFLKPCNWIWVLGVGLLTLGLSWVSNGFQSLAGSPSFFAAVLLGGGLFLGVWLSLKKESPPPWLKWLALGAVLLRLMAGVLWFLVLPVYGYGNPGEVAGYVFGDAYPRDTAAWEIAESDQSLTVAFRDYRLADQYGGLLFFSAAVYRYLGADVHQPLLIVVMAAAVAGVGVLFTWGFTKRLWGQQPAALAAFFLSLYPEAVLLGSSQTREAFTITLTAMALYGLVCFWQDHHWKRLGWVGLAFFFGVPLSYLYAILLAGLLALILLGLNRGQILKHWRLWLTLLAVGIAGIIAVWFWGDRIFPAEAGNPFDALSRWLRYAAKWETRNATLLSGWIDKVFRLSPPWMHAWIILGYGLVQPFLPAAIIARGNPVWWGIAIWRAVGWTALLFMLLLAQLKAAKNIRKDIIPFGLGLVIWGGMVIAAYRGGGDQWDNPRYRAIFASLQVGLAAWAWVEHKKYPDPWLRRILIGLGWLMVWFVPWYLRRYVSFFEWPLQDLFKTIALGVVSALLFWILDWVRES